MTPFEMARTLSAMSGHKRGRKPVFSANQFYPWKVEREIERYVSEWLAENGRRLKDSALVNYTADGVDDVNSLEPFTPADVESMAASFYDKVSLFGSDALDMFGDKTIGRPIGYFFTDTTVKNDFVKNFIDLCTTAAGDQKRDIANAVYQHRMFPDGKNLVKTIQDINIDYTKKKARFIARNETGNLNAVIQKTMMEGAGFTMYEWVAMPDGITRDAHRNMSGKICRWDDPTVYSDDGGKTWKKRTAGMFVGVPGQDYNCRCTAVPFESELEDNFSIKEPEKENEEYESLDSVDDSEIKDEIEDGRYKAYDNLSEAKDDFWRLHFQNKSRYGLSNNQWMWDTIWTRLFHTFKTFEDVKDVFGEKYAEYVWKMIHHSDMVGGRLRIKKMEI